jgi:hypothetical protein
MLLFISRLLIAHGADVNAQSSSGNTPLMYACAGGHEEVMFLFLNWISVVYVNKICLCTSICSCTL